MLIMFKPWRYAEDLRNHHQSWVDAYKQFLENGCSPEVIERIENMQILHECRDSRDAHYANRRARRQAGLSIELQRGGRGSNDFGEEDESDVLEHLESMDRSRSEQGDRARADIVTALEYAEQSGLIGAARNSNHPPDSSSNSHVQVEGDEHGAEIGWQKAYDDRKEQWKRWASAAEPVNNLSDASEAENQIDLGGLGDGSVFRNPMPAQEVLIRDADMLLHRESVPAGIAANVELEDIGAFAAQHNLNTEQARAFSIVAEHSKVKNNNKPLRMYLGGKGGTGKSKVIIAMQEYFIQRGEERRFRLSSFTGVAARNISGMTLHAALMFNQHSSSARSAKGKRDLMALWEGVDYLFIDEISMVGCAMLHDISHALSVAKGNDSAFGGISVVFAGDFAQLPPVLQTRLYTHLDKKTISKAGTKSGQKIVFGKLLWLSVQTVVILTQNMRQSGQQNRPFVELLDRLRDGRCTDADYDLLNTRLASNLSMDWASGPWSSAPVIVAENAMKDALNVQMAGDFAIRSGKPLHWYHSSDRLARNKPIEDPLLQGKLAALDSGKTRYRLGRIPLVIGMPVMVAQNFDVQGGVVNGCTGKLVSVRYKLGADGKRYALSCVVEAPDTTPGIIPGLPDHHVVALTDTVSMAFEHPHSRKTMTVKRTQLPILPGFAMTAHKAQGKTLPNCIVNLTGCQGTEAPYVMLSRVTSLEGLVILTPFSKSKICCRRSEDARTEFRRLEYLALRTIMAYGTPVEATQAAQEIARSYSAAAHIEPPAVPTDGADVVRMVNQLQRSNAVLTAPVRLVKLPTTSEGIARAAAQACAGPSVPIASSSVSSALRVPQASRKTVRLKKRKLDDTTPMEASEESPAKRRRGKPSAQRRKP